MAESLEKTKPEPPKPFVIKALEIAAWPLSIGTGWWWTNDAARNSVYDTIKHTDELAVLRKGIKTGMDIKTSREIFEGGNWGRVNKLAKDALELVEKGAETSVSIVNPLAQEHRRFDKETTKYFKKLGFNHTLDYLRGIHRNEALKAIMTGFGAGGITLGVVTMLADHEGLKRLFSRKEKANQSISK